ncbi:MAG: Gfo/Idh/MocA family oxidoreductase [Pseudolabrys sp.]|nr:Gfo/Idh/MocA family oxidoreductase [Pseudolabrys sp.]
MTASDRPIRLGVAGLGRAFTLMLPTLIADKRIRLAAATDSRPEARTRFTADFGAATYDNVEALCADPEIDAIYVATPHQLHAAHVCAAADHGKHVLVEKPMAVSIADCTAMIDAARRNNVHIVVGHSHSFNAPVLQARALIASGAYGAVRMMTALNYTDYMYRPRRPEEMDTAQGGGVVFSQGAHQIDIVRLLGGGMVESVRAATGSWDPARPTEGAYAALLSFAGGAFATASYEGYGRFDTDEFMDWIGEMGTPKDRSRYGAARRALAGADAAREAELKAARNYGGTSYAGLPAPATNRVHQHFGVMVISCDRADLRLTPQGVMIYGDDAPRLEPMAVPDIPRAEVIDELHAAVIDGKPPLHDGTWARATLEVCLAILRSAREKCDVTLVHQTAAP